MADLEKVIKGLEDSFANQGCGYMDGVGELYAVSGEDLQNAIALLKEQEAVKPILEQDSMVCGVCGHEVIWQKMLGDGIWADEKLDYCPHCGRKVKWDDI